MAQRDLVVRLIGDDASLRRAFVRSSTGTKQFSRDVSAATRGAAAGSGAFRSLGRSIVFASGGFLAFTSGAAFLRKTVDAAKEAQVANAQLATQLANSGRSFQQYRAQIDLTVARLSALSGIQDDELKSGLTTILRTVPDVTKALRDLGTATDLARSRHISLASAATIIAKVEAGNTTLLRRQGFQIAKNVTAEQALATVRAKIAGQAAAGTTAQERFGAVLHQTEEIIGAGILPTLNKYLVAGSRWLQQMNESGKLQADVSKAARGFAVAMSSLVGVVKTVDRLTGGFKHTLELLAGLKLSSWALGVAQSFGLVGTSARTSAERALLLRSALLKLAGIGVITIGIEVLLNKKSIDNKVSGFLDQHGLGFLGGANSLSTKGLNLGNIDQAIETAKKLDNGLLAEALKKYKAFLNSQDAKAAAALSATRGSGPHGAALLAQLIGEAETETSKKAVKLTASQRNTFFDNQIARILLRGGLGTIQQQITALQKANGKIQQRITQTKDITRRLNLEDELLQNAAQIKDLQKQAAADALQKRQDAFSEFIAKLQLGVTKAQATSGISDDIAKLKALEAGIKAEIAEFGRTTDLAGQLFDVQQQLKQAQIQKISAKEFFTLGLSPTGDTRVPLAATLRKQLGTLQEGIKGTVLDTRKNQSELSRIRKVLSESLVPTDVRSKIRQMLDDLTNQLKDHARKLTGFRHTSANALLSGLGLDAETTRILRQRLAQVGAGGTVPGVGSAAFAGAGTTVIPLTVNLDGKKIAQNTTTHQRRQDGRRSDSRRGPYAGRR